MTRRKKPDIDGWRDKIDAVDDQLLVLLNQRASCSIEIGWIKRARDLEIYVPAREVQILRRMSHANRGPLREESIRRLFERIIDESRATERVVCSNSEGNEPKEKEPGGGKKRVSKRRARGTRPKVTSPGRNRLKQ